MLKITGLAGATALFATSVLCAPSSPDARAAAALAKMTTEEKVSLLHGPMTAFLSRDKRPSGVPVSAGFVAGVPRLGVPMLVETDASLGVSNLNALRPGDVATALPSGLSLAASFDPDLARAGGAMIGAEARAKGMNVMLAGGVNLVRDPRGGRNFEYLGEDPVLAGTLVGSQIQGIQSNHIIATIKHFALNDQETGRNVLSVQLDEPAMRESDLLAFEIGLENGDPGSVMCAYNRVGGVFACENSFLLNDVLRRDWGFKGFVMSDWGATHSTEALLKGLDQQSGEQLDQKRWFSTELTAALALGAVPQSAVDTAAGRVLRSVYAEGLDDHPTAPGQPIDYASHAKVAETAGAAGIVLLKNEGGLLPLSRHVRSIALIGGHADLGVLSGGGSSQVTPVGGFKLLEATGKGPAAWIKRGYGGTPPLEALRAAFPNATVTYLDGRDVTAAAQAARAADVAIVVGEKFAAESQDAADISLGDGQDSLIAAVASANPRTVVVLETGDPVLMPWRAQTPAILEAWYPGQRGGAAIAEVLSGAVNPSGRLPVTFPALLDQLPNPRLPGADAAPADKDTRATYGLQAGVKPFDVRYPEGSDVGYRWYDAKGQAPLYPFGYGLSYTHFAYDGLRISGGSALTVHFRVANTGARAGTDVPQVYVKRPGKAKRLVGWGRPTLSPGQSQDVTVTADPRVLADFDAHARRWVLPAGRYEVEVATSATTPVLVGSAEMRRQSLRP
jgi:beta-glucosidase